MAILLLAVVPIAAQEPSRDFTILLKSRQFVPAPGMSRAMVAQLRASPTGRRHVLIQLEHIPTAEERETLEQAGVKLLAYVPHNAWFASVPATVSLSDEALSSARWLGSILPQDKLPAGLWEGQVGPWAVNADGSVDLDVLFFADVPLEEARRIVAAFGGYIEEELPEFHRLRVRVPRQVIAALASEDGVQWIEEAPPPKVTSNDGSRARTKVDTVQAAPYNLNGSGVDLGIWDKGVVYNHVDFSGRLTVVDSYASVVEHATRVAGTMAGSGANSAAQGGSPCQWKGMAPCADIISYYWDNNLSDHDGAINTYGIELSHNSWGYRIDDTSCDKYGYYGWDATGYDWIVTGIYGKRIVVVFAAGNERRSSYCTAYKPYGNIWPPATAKDIITVGATHSDNDSMTDFSSWGPVDDGRIKPDVVAPGCKSYEGIKTTVFRNSYARDCGTSYAAPAVSGISALLIQQYRNIYGGIDPWPSTVKALLIHTAVDLGNPGPDYAFGYGRVDAQAAMDVLRDRDLRQDSVSNGVTNTYTITVSAGSPSARVTLVWDDPAGTVNANPALVNNLDLTLVEPNGVTVHFPWVLNPTQPYQYATRGTDSRNNVEQVYVTNPTPGIWTIRVAGTSVPQGPQQYSLVAENFVNAPVIDWMLSCGQPGSPVAIRGSAFGKTQGPSTVQFSPGVTATVTFWEATQINCIIPEGAEAGDVTVTTVEGTSNGVYFANQPCCQSCDNKQYLPLIWKSQTPCISCSATCSSYRGSRFSHHLLAPVVSFSPRDDFWGGSDGLDDTAAVGTFSTAGINPMDLVGPDGTATRRAPGGKAPSLDSSFSPKDRPFSWKSP